MKVFDSLINIFRSNVDNIEDKRRQRDDNKYKYGDIILSAFSIFYFQNKSWLSFQRKMKKGKNSSNVATMFGVVDIPSNTHIKKILDGMKPEVFKKVYEDTFIYIEQRGILKEFVFMKKYLLVALDGTCYHTSKKVHCKCCQSKTDSKTKITTYFHNVITPTIVHPKFKKVLALFQEFISNEDGNKKQDCEVNASKRWLDSFNMFKKYKIIILGDDLYSRYPMISAILSKGHSFILVCKKESHKVLYRQIESFKRVGSCKTYTTTRMHNGKKQTLKYSWINGLLLNGNKVDNTEVNWCELIIEDANGQQIHCFSFVTDLEITQKNIEDIISAGRTRWKIENENNNTLKTKGYNLSHNYGHGKENLSKNICCLNILAFLFHTVQEFEDEPYILLHEIIGTREEFFAGLSFLTTIFCFKSYDLMIEWTIKARRTKEHVDMGDFIV